MKYFILFLLFYNQVQSQYVMEWESPIGLELYEFADNNSPIKRSSFFDFNNDGNVDLISSDDNDNYYFYDVLTNELLWSFQFNDTDGLSRYRFIGFGSLIDNNVREAIFYQDSDDGTSNDYCLIINTQTNAVFQIALDADEESPGLWSGNSFSNEGYLSEFPSNDKLIIQFSDHFEIWGDGNNEAPELNINDVMTSNKYNLNDIYPNPFNPSTTVSYSLDISSHIEVSIYDIEGKLVEILQEGTMAPGIHTVNWNPNVSSGQYFVQLRVNNEIIDTNKALFVK